tara:strand:- start:403 stop:675 length:273 start_codon:yes stop_codon:yes gene_type:complete
MSNLENLEEDQSGDSFKSKDISEMDRSEKRSRIRFYKKELSNHNKKKPFFNVDVHDDFSEEGYKERQDKLKGWSIRYATLLMKIQELEVK